MHSCITTLLFILATLSSALTLKPSSISSQPKHHLGPAKHTFCIEPYTNYWDAGYKPIFFNHPEEPLFNLTILTGYMRFYPRTIATWLEEKGFRVANASTIPKSELCGWIPGEAVTRVGRQHGFVYWKRSKAESTTMAPPARNSTATPAPRPPNPILAYPRPKDATFLTIRSILHDNSPDADRYYFMTVLLGTACGTLGFMLVFYGLAGYAALSKKRKPTQRSADIELDQIKVQDLSGSGMQRFSADNTEAPKSAVEIERCSAASGDLGSVGKTVVEPPPVYAVDGAGR